MSAFQVILVVIARLTTSMEMGQLIQEHCSCKVPCMCGCQALAQNVFLRQRAHVDAMLCLLRQGKVHMALQYAQARGALDRDVLLHLLKQCPSVQLVETLLTEEEPRTEGGGSRTLLPMGVVLTTLCDIGQWDMGKGWLQRLVYNRHPKTGQQSLHLSVFLLFFWGVGVGITSPVRFGGG